MLNEVSVLRLYVMRCMDTLNFAFVGSGVWAEFTHRQKPWDPIVGSAFSKTFWMFAVYLVIPWPYVVRHYIKKSGNPWRSTAQGAAQ